MKPIETSIVAKMQAAEDKFKLNADDVIKDTEDLLCHSRFYLNMWKYLILAWNTLSSLYESSHSMFLLHGLEKLNGNVRCD